MFNLVRPANYNISAEFRGFKTAVKDNVILEVAKKVRVNFTLELGRNHTDHRSRGRVPLAPTRYFFVGFRDWRATIVTFPCQDATSLS